LVPRSTDHESLFVKPRAVSSDSSGVLAVISVSERPLGSVSERQMAGVSEQPLAALEKAKQSHLTAVSVDAVSVNRVERSAALPLVSTMPVRLSPVVDADPDLDELPARTVPLTVTEVYDQTAEFVWRALQRLGVAQADLDDVLQEVFVVVHKKLRTYDERCKLTTWLFGICVRVASRHRQRAHLHRESLTDTVPESVDVVTPEQQTSRRQAIAQLELLLSRLSTEKRVTFVMFELERMSCEEIAELTDVPVGTVYSRLHAARKEFSAAVERLQKRERAATGQQSTSERGGTK
jgi:RNA polymerase sigma-70 factor (ECF subfamily)